MMTIEPYYPAAGLAIAAVSVAMLKLLDRLAHRVPRWIIAAAVARRRPLLMAMSAHIPAD